jgi:plastocyanin
MKKLISSLVVLAFILTPSLAFGYTYGGGFYANANYPNNYYTTVPASQNGTNYVQVSSCLQSGSNIWISRNFATPYMLTSGVRDAGHGLRNYTLNCVSPTMYKVQWTKANSTVQPSPVGPMYATVNMTNSGFVPKTLIVKKGTQVTWTNTSQLAHTVTADNGTFGSGVLMGGQTYTRTFSSVGNFPYYSVFYGGVGGNAMSGTVVVVN